MWLQERSEDAHVNTSGNMSNTPDLLVGANKYTRRITADEMSCFVCSKFTTTVLTNGKDWFYTCPSHLFEYSFCTPVAQPVQQQVQPKPQVPTVPEKKKEEDTKDTKDDKDGKDNKSSTPSVSQFYTAFKSAVVDSVSSSGQKKPQQHQQPKEKQLPREVVLHSRFWFLRQDTARKRATSIDARNKLSQIPSVPTTIPK